MAVRNFYATITNDDHGAPVHTGPVGKAEGFSIRVQQRDNGEIVTALRVNGFVDDAGTLTLRVTDRNDQIIHEYVTFR